MKIPAFEVTKTLNGYLAIKLNGKTVGGVAQSYSLEKPFRAYFFAEPIDDFEDIEIAKSAVLSEMAKWYNGISFLNEEPKKDEGPERLPNETIGEYLFRCTVCHCHAEIAPRSELGACGYCGGRIVEMKGI